MLVRRGEQRSGTGRRRRCRRRRLEGCHWYRGSRHRQADRTASECGALLQVHRGHVRVELDRQWRQRVDLRDSAERGSKRDETTQREREQEQGSTYKL